MSYTERFENSLNRKAMKDLENAILFLNNSIVNLTRQLESNAKIFEDLRDANKTF